MEKMKSGTGACAPSFLEDVDGDEKTEVRQVAHLEWEARRICVPSCDARSAGGRFREEPALDVAALWTGCDEVTLRAP